TNSLFYLRLVRSRVLGLGGWSVGGLVGWCVGGLVAWWVSGLVGWWVGARLCTLRVSIRLRWTSVLVGSWVGGLALCANTLAYRDNKQTSIPTNALAHHHRLSEGRTTSHTASGCLAAT
ncbi:MAG: hypothetical protein ACPGWR_32170, partial [Ardenticatenaceae bacterium]